MTPRPTNDPGTDTTATSSSSRRLARARAVVPLLALVTLVAVALPADAAQPAKAVRVFTFSRDSLAGFSDERLDGFRREMGRHLESFMDVAYGRDEADVEVLFLGHGELTLDLGREGESDRHLFRLDTDAPRMWVLVRIGDFTKELSFEGRGGRDVSRLAKLVADWLKTNATAVRERLIGPGG